MCLVSFYTLANIHGNTNPIPFPKHVLPLAFFSEIQQVEHSEFVFLGAGDQEQLDVDKVWTVRIHV